MSQSNSNTGQPLVKPSIKAVLKSLDLQLEAELARYQQQMAKTALTQHKRETATEPAPDTGGTLVNLSPTALSDVSTSSLPQSAAEAEDLVATNAQIPLSSYLESSEELLRALAQKQLASPQKSFLDYLFTPLGMSAIFLVLITSVLLGFILMSPESSPLLSELSEPETTSTEGAETVPAQVEQPPRSSNPNSLEDIDTNSNLNERLNSSAKPQPSQNTAPHSDLASALLPPSLRPQSQSPATTSPQPESDQIPTAQIQSNYYYVLVEDVSNSSLTQVQNVVEDAYLLNFPEGVRIQVGAFTQQEDAKNLVEKLKQQGITALIYHAE